MESFIGAGGILVTVRQGVAIAFALAFSVAGCGDVDDMTPRQESKRKTATLNVYNWSNYIGEHTVENFQKETGIEVNYGTYDSNLTLEGYLLNHTRKFDVVAPTDTYFVRQVQAGVFRPIDKAKLKNYSNIDPLVPQAEAAYDPGNVYGVPYFWGQ